jgi:hypothetical protein
MPCSGPLISATSGAIDIDMHDFTHPPKGQRRVATLEEFVCAGDPGSGPVPGGLRVARIPPLDREHLRPVDVALPILTDGAEAPW